MFLTDFIAVRKEDSDVGVMVAVGDRLGYDGFHTKVVQRSHSDESRKRVGEAISNTGAHFNAALATRWA